MSIKDRIIHFFKNTCYNSFIYITRYKIEQKNIQTKKKLVNKIKLLPKQEMEIQKFFKQNYGRKISTKWHRLYQSYTGNFDKRYFPEIIFSTELENLICDRAVSKQFTDKAMVELLYKSVENLNIPKTLVLNCSGIWYDSNRNIITKDKALKILNNCGKNIIKKTVDSCSGRGVLIVNIKDGYDLKNKKTLGDIIKQFGKNFIVQECIENCQEISKIYAKSLNTFRVMTYVVDGKMYHVPLTMRIGQGNNEVYNIHAGGMFIHISDDGELSDRAFTEYQDIYEKHPDTGVIFKGYKISGIDKMIEIAYKCHGRTPHLRLISWDFTIDKDERITLIEVNLNGQSIWFPQMASGKAAFGENTEYMLNLLRDKKKNKN